MKRIDKTYWCDRHMMQSQYVGLCLTEKAFQETMRLMGVPVAERPRFIATDTAHATVHFLRHPKRGRWAVVCLKDWEGRPGIENAGLLVHEAVHIWQDEMRSRGEDCQGLEINAYGIQQLAQHLMVAFVKQTTGKDLR